MDSSTITSKNSEELDVILDGNVYSLPVVGTREMYWENRCSCGSLNVIHIRERSKEYDYCMDCNKVFNKQYDEYNSKTVYCWKYN